jgi:hypothetical protein
MLFLLSSGVNCAIHSSVFSPVRQCTPALYAVAKIHILLYGFLVYIKPVLVELIHHIIIQYGFKNPKSPAQTDPFGKYCVFYLLYAHRQSAFGTVGTSGGSNPVSL